MNGYDILDALTTLYARLLHLYPRKFRDEFAEEMQIVFQDSVKEAGGNGMLSMIFICLRELGGLPFNILREFWYEFKRKETLMVTNEKVVSKSAANEGASHWDAFNGMLPFVLFGVTCMFTKMDLPIHGGYPYLVFFAIALLGLLIGLVKGFPRWAYSYLGWSMVMSFWWMGMPTDTFKNSYSPITHNQLLGWWSWVPFLITIGIGLLVVRSIHPLRKLITDIWKDWTLLSLGLYTFGSFIFLLFDENHHPYLFAFMLATTLVIAASIWAYMKSTSIAKRVVAILSGYMASYSIVRICDATWDWAAYYGFPSSPPKPWYLELTGMIGMIVFWSAIMFWPALIGLVRYFINNRQRPGMVA